MMPRIVVVGSSNTDLTVRLSRLPAPGQTVLGSGFASTPGGKGANQAVAACRAGGDVTFIAAVGDDPLGREALERYRREGIDVSFVRVIALAPSGVALIFVAEDGENMIGVAPGANHALAPADIDRLPEEIFRPGDVLLAGLEVPLETALHVMKRAARAGMRVLLNPAPAPDLSEADAVALLSAADVVTPNRVEALALARVETKGGDAALDRDGTLCAGRLLQAGARAAVVTLGARGCLVATAAERRTVEAPRVGAVDTVGAGDAFNGALAVALGEGRGLVEAAAWACTAGALAVTQAGAQAALPYRQAIDRLAHEARVSAAV
jgi:ribokinase